MIVMPSNNTGFTAGRLFGKYEGMLGHLHSVDRPFEPKNAPPKGIVWALDNGVFGAWEKGREWSPEPLYRYLDAYADWGPAWVVVPDWVGDREETLRRWDAHAPAIKAFGAPLAFAVQDGMDIYDVPFDAAVVFVGGSSQWKWKNLEMWTSNFPRVHVGRVNTRRLLEVCESAGAESCDGTGWFRHPKRTAELEKYLSDRKQREHETPCQQ
ncbi:MAG: hypothetical protein WC718_00260 [Phycisphaerales bacterium]|jgi:hypothetical protein